ncbi:MAG TPA: GDP-L-fucose synthase [Acetobacteraceae bacterium]|jgi:GDP-L-fucose synthase|nr:GDP-L-fucose synthase [Acetobacteraceae bacterium]
MSLQELSLEGRRVWVAGHRGMVGAALVRRMAGEGAVLLTVPHARLDLRRQRETEEWIAGNRPEYILIAAAKVGGILANDTYPAQFLYDNLMIQSNIVEAARKYGAEKVLLLGSSCIYPRLAPQPIPESSLLTGPLEETNQWYAIAKIAGVKLAQAYRREYGLNLISVMPTNLYGPADDYDLRNSHVAAALLRRIHQAKEEKAERVVIWGSGAPLREFLHVDDLADACLFLLKTWDDADPINIGSGQEVSITELAGLIAEVVGWAGRFEFDASKPDGTPRKLLDTTRLTAMGWTPSIDLKAGLASAYVDFRARWNAGEFAAEAVRR